MISGRPFPAYWILLFWAGTCVCMQYVTVEKFAVFPPSQSHGTLANFIGYTSEQITFDVLDAVLLALFLISASLLLYQEWRRRVLSVFLQHCFSSPTRTLVLLVFSLLVSVRFYFSGGELNWGADASHHIAMSWLAAEAISAGEAPVWTFFMGTGSPYLQNYGFAFFYLVGLVDLALRDLSLSLKLTMAAGHLLSGIGMYFLAAGLCRSRRAGFIAGLAYSICFWHTQQVLIMGRLSLSLFYAVLPWAFHYVERVAASPYKMRAALLGGVSVALLTFTHPGYGTYALVLLACYSLLRLWSCRKRPDAVAILHSGLLLFLIGATFGSYMNAGIYLERGHTRMHEFSIDLSGVPDPTWQHLLGWSNFRFWLIPPSEPVHWYGGYLGISLVLLALAGGAVALRRHQGRLAPCWVCLVLVALVIIAYRWPPIADLPLIHAFNASRYLLFLSFFLALAAGMGTYSLLSRGPRWLARSRWYTILLLVLMIDLFPTTFVQPYNEENYWSTSLEQNILKPIAVAAAPFLQRDELPEYRAHWVGPGLYSYKRQAYTLYLGATPISEAFHPGELRTLQTFTQPFTGWANTLIGRMDSLEQLKAHPLYKLLSDGLYLLNTRYLIADSPNRFTTVLSMGHSPIVVSGRLEGYDRNATGPEAISARIGVEPEMDEAIARALEIIARTGVQRPLGSLACERILVRDMEGQRNLETAPVARVLSHVVRRQEVEMKVEVSADCYARLAYAYFPYLRVSVDGKPVRPLQTAGRFMALPLEAGEHEIAIEARLSPLRRGLLALAAVSLVLALALVVREHRNLRTAPVEPISPRERPSR